MAITQIEMKKEEYINLIDEEIELYTKIFKQNQYLLDKKDNIDVIFFEQKVYNKDKLLKKIQEIDKELALLWENWEQVKHLFSEHEKDKIRKLKELIEENLKIENLIIEIFQNYLTKIKAKTISVNKGKNAFNAYKSKKVNIPYFLNEKG